MIVRATGKMNFVRTGLPIPTVEIDLDSIDMIPNTYVGIVEKVMIKLANDNPEYIASLYVQQATSANFYDMIWSAFIGVAANSGVTQIILNALEREFKRIKGARVRQSDYIKTSSAILEFHIEEGKLWCIYDASEWRVVEAPVDTSLDNSKKESVLTKEIIEGMSSVAVEDVIERTSTGIRFRAARSDAHVASIRRSIEEVFGLPEGSVALCGPDKRPLRGDALIETLRKRWDE